MKRKVLGTVTSVMIGILGMTILALPLFSQKDFNMDEKRLVDRFKRANPYYIDGAKQFTKGNLDKAEKKLIEALAIMPEHADASCVMAEIQLKRKDLSKALALILDAEKYYVSNAKFHTFTYQQYLDRLRQQRQDFEENRQRILDQMSQMPPLSMNEPAQFQERGRAEAALKYIARYIQMIDSRLNSPIPPTFEIPADYHFIHGNVLFQMGQRADAVAHYQEAIRLDPIHGKAFNNLALVLSSQGQCREALDCLLQAEAAGVKINPDFKRDLEAKIPRQ